MDNTIYMKVGSNTTYYPTFQITYAGIFYDHPDYFRCAAVSSISGNGAYIQYATDEVNNGWNIYFKNTGSTALTIEYGFKLIYIYVRNYV